jgi:hypothetical protein
MSKIVSTYRLPPERQLRLYIGIARTCVQYPEGLGIALAAIRNVQDAIARLQEHHVRKEAR